MNLRIIISIVVFSALIACKKEECTTPPVTTPKTQEELLTAKTWKAEEIRVMLASGSSLYYKRGGASNTVNYDTDSLKFSTNNTGVYYYTGLQYTTTWTFTNTEKSKMTLVINYPSPVTLNLENVTLADNYFTYSQYVPGGAGYLASCRRLPN